MNRLAGDEQPGELKIRLACTGCPPRDRVATGPGEQHDELPALTIPIRRDDDPESVVRCGDCGKKHSRDSLEVIDHGGN